MQSISIVITFYLYTLFLTLDSPFLPHLLSITCRTGPENFTLLRQLGPALQSPKDAFLCHRITATIFKVHALPLNTDKFLSVHFIFCNRITLFGARARYLSTNSLRKIDSFTSIRGGAAGSQTCRSVHPLQIEKISQSMHCL